MTVNQLPGPSVPDGNPAAGQKRETWTPLRIVAIVIAVVLVIVLLVGFVLYNAIRNGIGGPPAAAVPAPIEWQSADFTLSAEQPVASGHLAVSVAAGAESTVAIGLNAGLPRANANVPTTPGAGGPPASIDPAAFLSIPSVRVTMDAAAPYSSSCLAPCELRLEAAPSCAGGVCVVGTNFTLELVSGNGQQPPSVAIAVTGAVTTGLSKPLPAGVRVDLIMLGTGNGDGS